MQGDYRPGFFLILNRETEREKEKGRRRGRLQKAQEKQNASDYKKESWLILTRKSMTQILTIKYQQARKK